MLTHVCDRCGETHTSENYPKIQMPHDMTICNVCEEKWMGIRTKLMDWVDEVSECFDRNQPQPECPVFITVEQEDGSQTT